MAEIAGLKLIVPTSVSATGAGSSATVSASGKISFTAAQTLTIDDCFLTTYDNYLFVMRVDGSVSGQGISYRLRVNGANESGANYTAQRLTADGSSVTGARVSSGTSATISAIDDELINGVHFYLYGPYLAQPTVGRGISAYSDSGAGISDWASTHSLSTSYTSIWISISGGNMSGSLTIYGLSQ